MGTLAACYLQTAGWPVTVVRPGPADRQRTRLRFTRDAHEHVVDLPVCSPAETGPISHLLVACKTPYTSARLASLALAPDALVLRLQNGIGSLDGRLAVGHRLIEVVTTSAVKSAGPGRLDVVAENQTGFGGGTAPALWPALAAAWPGARWHDDIRWVQWRKLVINAVLNPLTALHDVDNGALATDPALAESVHALADEADTILAALDARWPARSRESVYEVARATADNMSSMRADIQAGAVTEIDAINGWLIGQAERLGIAAPAHRQIRDRILARSPAR